MIPVVRTFSVTFLGGVTFDMVFFSLLFVVLYFLAESLTHSKKWQVWAEKFQKDEA
jgi:Na+-transporting methylmalonyl-CoA/oxaloacetate decarboxylase gamma subunit